MKFSCQTRFPIAALPFNPGFVQAKQKKNNIIIKLLILFKKCFIFNKSNYFKIFRRRSVKFKVMRL